MSISYKTKLQLHEDIRVTSEVLVRIVALVLTTPNLNAIGDNHMAINIVALQEDFQHSTRRAP